MSDLEEMKEEFKDIFPEAVEGFKTGDSASSLLWYGFKAGFKTAKGEDFER